MPIGPIVSTGWLSEQLGAEDLLVLDASVEKRLPARGSRFWQPARDAFEESHIPGARFANLVAGFSEPDARFSFTRPSARRFAESAGRLGANRSKRIVVYDNSTGLWAARLWWLFRSFGHDDVAVLDGGLAAWRNVGLPLEAGAPQPPLPARFDAEERPHFFTDRTDIEAIVYGRRPGVLACVLRQPVFDGLENYYARPGHIPGSISSPYVDLIGSDNRFRPEAELRAALKSLIETEEPVIIYCGGGITAAGTALVLTALGVEDVSIYDGSLEEWSADPTLPMSVA